MIESHLEQNSELVSIVVCTYNGSKFLNEQINSLINQDYKPIEIVVVDDCSTDNTWILLNDWKERYPDLFRLYKNDTNLGYNRNFEKGIQLAKGVYISLSDQDDIWLPTKVSESVAAINLMPNAILAHCKNVAMENGALKSNHTNLRIFFQGSDLRKLFLHSQFSGHAIIFKRSLLEFIIPFPDGIIYDWWISVNACAIGSIAFVDKILVHHRVHDSNATRQINKSNVSSKLDIVEILELFNTIKYIPQQHRAFLNELIAIIRNHNTKQIGKIDWQLFLFFFQNRKIIYGHKKRLFPIFSQAKHAFHISKMNLNGIGGEI